MSPGQYSVILLSREVTSPLVRPQITSRAYSFLLSLSVTGIKCQHTHVSVKPPPHTLILYVSFVLYKHVHMTYHIRLRLRVFDLTFLSILRRMWGDAQPSSWKQSQALVREGRRTGVHCLLSSLDFLFSFFFKAKTRSFPNPNHMILSAT